MVEEVDAELAEYEVDDEATEQLRERASRGARAAWLDEDPEDVAGASATASSTCSTSSATTA